ncbi:putative reverse transcriptase domain-containing protein [Tanacetum coccineum]
MVRTRTNDNKNGQPDIAAIIAQQLQNIIPQIVTQVTNNVNNRNNNNNNGNNNNNNGNNNNNNGNGGNNGCSYKGFQACGPKEYDEKGGAIALTRWIEKMENVLDNSGCSENLKARGREAGIGANHAAYTDRFHELAKLVPHLVTPESARIKKYVAGLTPEIRGMLKATQPTTIQDAILRADILTDEAISCGTLSKSNEKRKAVEETGKSGGSLCFNYQRPGHFAKDCRAPFKRATPVNAVRMEFEPGTCNRNTRNNGKRATGRAFNVNVNAVEALQDPKVVTGTFSLNAHFATVLFDSGADFSFISIEFAPLLNVKPSIVNPGYVIEVADGKKVEVDRIIRDCKLELGNSLFSINLIPLGHGRFDVIVGMDWLSQNKAVIVCHEKVVEIPLEGSGIDSYPNTHVWGFVDKFVRDPNKTPDSSQRPPQNCPKCGNPVDGLYCRQCALLRKKLKEVWSTICYEDEIFQDFLNTSESSNDKLGDGEFCQRCTCMRCGSGLSKGLCLICASRYGNNLNPNSLNDSPNISKNVSQSPSLIDHHCCYGCGDSLDEYLKKFSSAITLDLPKSNSLIMEDKHLDTIPEPESDDLIKSSIEDLFHTLSESDGISESECDLPVCDDSSPKKDEIDFLLEEFVGELALIVPIPPGIVEADFDPKGDIHFIENLMYDNSFPRPSKTLKDDSETVIDSNNDYSSSDNDSLYSDDIDYVEASPPDSELVSLEVVEIVIPEVGGIDTDILLTIKDDILREKLLNVNLLIAKIEALKDNPTPSSDFVTKSSSTSLNFFLEETNTFDNSLPESETFCFNLEEISSGSPTSYLDLSLPDYEAFFCDSEPDLGNFTMDVVEDISDNPTRELYVHVLHDLPTHPTLHLDSDFTLSSDSLGSDLVVSFPSGTRNKIFDPGIFIEVQSEKFLSWDEFSISFIRDPLSPVIDSLLPFLSKNEDKVVNSGILAMDEEKSPHPSSH